LTEWREIESAPKDGSDIIACRLGYIPQTVKWVAHKGESRWCADHESLGDSFEEYWTATRYEPTHWLPLPTPPKI
jgi:hypothetical protein